MTQTPLAERQATTAKVQVRGLSMYFPRQNDTPLEVLREIDLDVYSGEFLSIVGASGCGKTTFLRILDGLVAATSGHILLNGREVTRPGSDRGFVFQSDSLMPWRTVLDNVIFGLEIQGKVRKETIEHAQRLIRLVGLQDFVKNY